MCPALYQPACAIAKPVQPTKAQFGAPASERYSRALFERNRATRVYAAQPTPCSERYSSDLLRFCQPGRPSLHGVGGLVDGGSRVGGSGSGLVGLDGSAEAMSVGDVVHATVAAVGVGEAVGSDAVVVGISNLVAALVVAVSIVHLVTELVGLGSLRRGRGTRNTCKLGIAVRPQSSCFESTFPLR
ncbi:hypothetical protein HPB49_008758 [Dermacentor silvarum]|uniref:Uncharacterized protein n=1 Tax=Dermacentor silvarum TaxID=543639 RepID=A0ACB8DBZ6_DERSI|nr:hypothetical protein HPB49_008758 [Dermacentor silvarum]